MVEDRVVGLKSREVYEAPAATMLIAAHIALERLVLTRDELRFKASCDQRYAELDLRRIVDVAAARRARRVQRVVRRAMTGEVRLRLFHGAVAMAGVRSPFALYDE